MLDGAPDRHPLGIGRRHERVRLDREMGDHRERVVVLDDAVGGDVGVPPAEAPFLENVGVCEPLSGANRRILDERRRGIERLVDGEHRRKLVVLDADGGGRRLRRILGLRGNRDDRLAEELRLSNREHRAIVVRRTAARHRVRQVRSGHDAAHAVEPPGLVRIDASDSGAGAVQMNELDVQDVLEPDVRGVALRARDALDAAGPPHGTSNPALRHQALVPAASATAATMRL